MHGLPHPATRRSFLRQAACGFGGLALGALAGSARSACAASLPAGPHFAPRAKRVIFLFMQGGVSQVDSFDYKPRLAELNGQQMPFDDARQRANTGDGQSTQRVLAGPWKFAQQGHSGTWASDLFPEIARRIDDVCLLRGVHTTGVAHGPATLFLHCGAANFIRPSLGSWVLYGLGSESDDLPGFVSIAPSAGNGGARNYGSAFLPAEYQGVGLGRAGQPFEQLRLRNLAGESRDAADAARWQSALESLNRAQQATRPEDSALEATIQSYALAARMQLAAPRLFDFRDETPDTHELYGLGAAETDRFGRQCLLARRMCEAGVRFVQVNYGDNSANPAWDQHSDLPKHAVHARAVDRPVAGLLADLQQRGLLEDTLVWFGSEFGRTPYAEKNGTGRDHNPEGFTVWLAGGGVKQGFTWGATDELGQQAVEGRVHLHDLHATILHCLGLDHARLTYRYAGRDFRLTDVAGRVVHEVLA